MEEVVEDIQLQNYNGSGFLPFPRLLLKIWTAHLGTRVTISNEALRLSSKHPSQ